MLQLSWSAVFSFFGLEWILLLLMCLFFLLHQLLMCLFFLLHQEHHHQLLIVYRSSCGVFVAVGCGEVAARHYLTVNLVNCHSKFMLIDEILSHLHKLLKQQPDLVDLLISLVSIWIPLCLTK